MNSAYTWSDISNDEFLGSATGKENQVTLIWTPSLPANIKSRRCKITSVYNWTALMDNSFIPRYKQGRQPTDPTAEIFNLNSCCLQANYPEQVQARLLLKIAPSIQITTAYDNNLNRRLIVDGLKRAIGMKQMILLNQAIPESTVLECYGTNVSSIFPLEFMHIR